MQVSRWPFLFLLFLLPACATRRNSVQTSGTLKFIGAYTIPHNMPFNNTVVGGLSGIDYNGEEDVYYFISDDRSDINPARFYTAKLRFDEHGIDSLWFTGVTWLQNRYGDRFPSYLKDSANSCDPEAIRYNSTTREMVWSSEGERFVKGIYSVLADPWIYVMQKDGNFRDSFLLPSNMHVRASEKGPRRNSVFEGLCFAEQDRSLYASLEEPIYEDGPRAGLGDSTAWTRILKFDVASKAPVAQYAYPLDAVITPPIPVTAFKINGIVDILEWDKGQLLVLERSYFTGVDKNSIRLYLADLGKARDLGEIGGIDKKKAPGAVKKLLLTMDALPMHIDNIEGMCWGPGLPNGKRSLVFVSDNNFKDFQVTQVLVFQID
jgi:hypothetical protein